jgi:hypothetical protein
MKNKEEIRDFLKSVMRTGIRIRQRHPDKFEKSTLKTITLSLDGGVLGVTGCLKGQTNRKIQTLIFNKSQNSFDIKVWSLKKAKSWLNQYKQGIRKIENPEHIIQKVRITDMIKSMEASLIKRLPKAIEKILEE